VEVPDAATTSCLKSRLYNVLSNVTYSPSYRQEGASVINIQSTLRTATDACKNVSLAVLFGSNGNWYTVCTQSDVCVYAHIVHNIETLVGQNKYKNCDSNECRVSIWARML
jgi:hypothetical protein